MQDYPLQDDLKKIVPALVWYRPFEPFAYAFIRFCTGALLIVHGIAASFYSGTGAKLSGFIGQLPLGVIGAVELIGGALIALGLLTRPAALLLAVEWVLIAMAVPHKPGSSWLMQGATEHFPALLAAICFAFLLRGGGHYSLDRMIGKEI